MGCCNNKGCGDQTGWNSTNKKALWILVIAFLGMILLSCSSQKETTKSYTLWTGDTPPPVGTKLLPLVSPDSLYGLKKWPKKQFIAGPFDNAPGDSIRINSRKWVLISRDGGLHYLVDIK